MRRLAGLALVVPLLAGCGWASLLFGGSAPGRVVSSGTVTLESTAPSDVARWVRVERLPAKAVAGARIFASAGCTACHTYAGDGASILNAPDLSAIGTRHLGIHVEIVHLRDPAAVTPGSPMPSFRSLGPRRLRELAIFLEASKGLR